MGPVENIKNSQSAQHRDNYERKRIIEMLEIIVKSPLVAGVNIIWASDVEHMEKSMTSNVIGLVNE